MLTKFLLALFLMIGVPLIPGYAQADTPPPPDMLTWMNQFQQSVKSGWKPPASGSFWGGQDRTVLMLTVEQSGQLKALLIKESSGSKEIDDAAILAMRQVFPFLPLPSDIKTPEISINFKFDINTLGLGNLYGLARNFDREAENDQKNNQDFTQLNIQTCTLTPEKMVELAQQFNEQALNETSARFLVRQCLNAGEWEDLGKKITRYQAKYPKSMELFYYQAELAYALHDYPEALIRLQAHPLLQTEDEFITYGKGFFSLQGNTFFELVRTPEALEAWTKAIKYTPSNYQGELELITAYVKGEVFTPEMKQKYVQAKTARITACPSIRLYKDVSGPKLKEVVKQLDLITGYTP